MTVSEYLTDAKLTAADLARDIGCHRSYITRVAAGERALSMGAALCIWRARKVKLGPLDGLKDSDIAVLERVEARAA